jgi:hypothetical protein
MIGLMLLPVSFPYWIFALLLAANGIGSGMFAAPNTSSMMSSVPAGQRGVASGMRATFQNSGTALSIGAFFSLMIAGLASSLPKTLTSGLEHQGVSAAVAHQIGSLPPVSSLFATVLGVNPIQHLLASRNALISLSAAHQRVLTGREFFPDLISGPFHQGLIIVFAVAAGLSAIAALASLLRGGRYVPAEGSEGPARRKKLAPPEGRLGISPASSIAAVRRSRGSRSTQACPRSGSVAYSSASIGGGLAICQRAPASDAIAEMNSRHSPSVSSGSTRWTRPAASLMAPSEVSL